MGSLENPWEPRLTQQTGTQQAADSQLVVKPENRIYPQYITPSEMSLVRFHVQAKRICKKDGKDIKRYEKMNPNTLIETGVHESVLHVTGIHPGGIFATVEAAILGQVSEIFQLILCVVLAKASGLDQDQIRT